VNAYMSINLAIANATIVSDSEKTQSLLWPPSVIKLDTKCAQRCDQSVRRPVPILHVQGRYTQLLDIHSVTTPSHALERVDNQAFNNSLMQCRVALHYTEEQCDCGHKGGCYKL
jgi:hypothetical protein